MRPPRTDLPSSLAPSSDNDPVDGLTRDGVIQRIEDGPSVHKSERVLNKIGAKVDAVTDTSAANVVTTVQNIINVPAIKDAVEAGLNSFFEDIPWLSMKGLDEVARIHPFLTVAILAFKTAYNMELTRRENDKRTRSLYVDMKDMIAVLIQLRDVSGPQHVGSDGQTIEARLHALAEKTAQDIKDCANTCDTYSKKRLLVKVLTGAKWEAKLSSFIRAFSEHRVSFEQALVMHTARAMQYVKTTVEAIDQKLSAFQRIFETLVPAGETEMRDVVRENGGVSTVQSDDATLRDLMEYEAALDTKKARVAGAADLLGRKNTAMADLKDELLRDPSEAIAQNLKTFEGKFELYHRQLKEELSLVIREENRLMLIALKEGPHDKIENAELRAIWKDMGWKRNVDARLFIMTLQDHFREKVEDITATHKADDAQFSGIKQTDDWALPLHHDLGGEQVYEVVAGEPGLEPSTLARLLVGWQAAAAKYCKKIQAILDRMNTLRAEMKTVNLSIFVTYLRDAWAEITKLISGLKSDETSTDTPTSKFTSYAEYEEDRIQRNLNDINYRIDALDTVYVVLGRGRLEVHVLTLVYLLLKRHLSIFFLSKSHYIHYDEMDDHIASLQFITEAVKFRVHDLSEHFRQQKTDLETRFGDFVCGLFRYIHVPQQLWKTKESIRKARFSQAVARFMIGGTSTVSDEMLGEESNSVALLKFSPPESIINTTVYTTDYGPTAEQDPAITGPLKAVLGRWTGHLYYMEDDGSLLSAIAQDWMLYASSSGELGFTATDMGLFEGGFTVHISGVCSEDTDGTVHVRFTIIDTAEPDPMSTFVGFIDTNGALSAKQINPADPTAPIAGEQKIYLTRCSIEVAVHRPLPFELVHNKARALWRFALSYTLMERFIHLNLEGVVLPVTEQRATLAEVSQHTTPADLRYYLSRVRFAVLSVPVHIGVNCLTCSADIYGPRLICLECPADDSDEDVTDTLNFCGDKESCSQDPLRITSGFGEYHAVDHALTKVRDHVLNRDILSLRIKAIDGLELARVRWESLLSGKPQTLKPRSEGNQGSEPPVGEESATLRPGDSTEEPTEQQSIDITRDAAALSGVGEPVTTDLPLSCTICQTAIQLPCWYCLECPNTFICMPCWYYGRNPNDDFKCVLCSARRIEPLREITCSQRHVYTHGLVKVTPRPPPVPPQEVEDRIATLEKKVVQMRDRVDQMDSRLDRMETNLSERLLAFKGRSPGTKEGICKFLMKTVNRVARQLCPGFKLALGEQCADGQPDFVPTLVLLHDEVKRATAWSHRSSSLWDILHMDVHIEVSADEDDDIEFSNGLPNTAVYGKLAFQAAALMYRQHRTHVFSIYVFGKKARIFKWNRLQVVVTKAFEYRKEQDLLAVFFFNYARISPEGRGWDTSIQFASELDGKLLVERAESCRSDSALVPPLNEILETRGVFFKFTIECGADGLLIPSDVNPSAESKAEEHTIVIQNSFWHQSTVLTRRCTRVYIGLDTATGQLVSVKDFWRSARLRSEADVYRKLYSEDYPERQFLPRTSFAGPTSEDNTHIVWTDTEEYFHERLVQDVVYDLTTFKNSRELVQIIRDAVAASIAIYLRFRILHCDISPNNIMRDKDGRGVLIDFDHCFILRDGIFDDENCTRTGTWYVMSINILESSRNHHTILDDLEAHLWSFLFVALRFFPSTYRASVFAMFEEVTDSTFEDQAGGTRKAAYLERARGEFRCKPLEFLVTKLRAFFARILKGRRKGGSAWRKTFQRLLQDPSEILLFFDEALAMEGWPGSDKASTDKYCFFDPNVPVYPLEPGSSGEEEEDSSETMEDPDDDEEETERQRREVEALKAYEAKIVAEAKERKRKREEEEKENPQGSGKRAKASRKKGMHVLGEVRQSRRIQGLEP
ncbi:hypothetical protein EIP91_006013 [Steccherinum ochraceum]|uniref:Protein kinase domain-containing protein n=1 Tax=Steccherinum ochraceum TaxID=92696 RepID=A0A4R0R8Y6_9APHY|nr:hypothetical protein EIP91_006013 [Steccherinum ochraceum]